MSGRLSVDMFTSCAAGLGVEIGKIEDSRQCVSFGPRFQVLKSLSEYDLATKMMMVMVARGTGTRKTDWYPSMTAFTTKIIKDVKKLKK